MEINEIRFSADFSVEEYKSRYQKAQIEMSEQEIDALIISLGIHLRYLTGYRAPFWGDAPGIPLALIPKNPKFKPILILSRYLEFSSESTWIEDIRYVQPERPAPFNDPLALAVDAIESWGLKDAVIGMDISSSVRDNMPFTAYESVKCGLPNARILDANSVLSPLRQIKSTAEIEVLRKACETSMAAWKAGLEALNEGMSEKELAAVIGSTILQEGEEAGLYRPWIIYMAAGSDLDVWCNILPGNYRVQKGDLVLVDGGCTRKGYHCDFIRWGVVGEPSGENRYLLDTAIEALTACKEAVKPGVSCGQIHAIGKNVFEAAKIKHDDWQVWSPAGHGIGLEVHESPYLSPANEALLEPGMVITIEPLIVKSKVGRFAQDPDKRYHGRAPDMMVVEDNIVVTETGYDLLTPLQPYYWIV
jgi:Xaa-Pro aminopeptidase